MKYDHLGKWFFKRNSGKNYSDLTRLAHRFRFSFFLFILFATPYFFASTAHAELTVSGGTVLSGAIQVRPAENHSNSTTVTIGGTRDENTRVWVKNTSTRLTLPVTDGLVLWLDADDSSTITESEGKVAEWRDKSGRNNHLSAISGSEPEYVADAHNGREVIRFDSSRNKYLSFSSRITDIRTVFWLIKQDGPGNNYGPFLLGDSSSYDFCRGSNGQIWNSTYTHSYIKNSPAETRINGGQPVNGTTTILPGDQFILLSLVTAGNVQANRFSKDRTYPRSWQGDIAGLLVYNRALSNAERKSVEDYLLDFKDSTGTAGVEPGSGDWSIDFVLLQGDNALEIWSEDETGSRLATQWVDIFVDSVAPVVTGIIAPPGDSYTKDTSAEVIVDFTENTSDLNLAKCLFEVIDDNQIDVAGSFTISGDNQLTFAPDNALADSYYTVNVQLEDELGNRGSAEQFYFTIDTAPPPAPVINAVATPVHNPSQIILGTKESFSAILLDDQEIIGNTELTDWQHPVYLAGGANPFVFAARDRAGNVSAEATLEIYFDDIAPDLVDNLTLNLQGDSQTVILDWTGYDETLHGDIDNYRIYVESSEFSDVTTLTPHGSVNAGNFTYTITNLDRDTTYWFAVIAVDVMGNAHTEPNVISGAPVDIVAPEEVTNLSAESFADKLVFFWNHSVNSYGDLAGYRIYLADDAQGVFLTSDQNSYTAHNLDSAAGYKIRLAAFDNDGNESSGVTLTGVTLLDNPPVTMVSPRAGGVKLYWDAAEPTEYVKQYRVYVSEEDFSSVEGMTPKVTTTSLSVAVTGLSGQVAYHFAVTVMNASDGEQKSVNSITAGPTEGTNVSGEITKNTTWTLDKSPYIVTGNITVRNNSYSYNSSPSSATLTIEPGVKVRFEPGIGLYIGLNYYRSDRSYFGALSAQGTVAQPIIFTSNVAIPAPGDWQGIYFRDETHDVATLLDHCVIEYGGHTNNSNIYFALANPTVRNSTIRNSSSHGIYLNAASPTIDGNFITNNSSYGISCNSNSAGYIKNNVISYNGNAPINVHPDGLRRMSGNSGSGNGKEYIRIYGGTITSNGTWAKQDIPYVIDGDVTVRKSNYTYNSSPSAATLTLEPGVEVRFSPGTGLYIGLNYYRTDRSYFGALSAQGTEANPIIFTSNASEPAPGDWKGIHFRDETYDAGTNISNCIIEYGGHTNNTNIYFADGAHPTVQNSNIRYSSWNGIYGADKSSAAITNNTFSGNLGPAINVHPMQAYKLNGNTDPIDGQSYISIRGGEITSNTTWKERGLPFVIGGDVTVRKSNYTYNSSPSAATLTIEPGVEVRFNPGTGLYIGLNYYRTDRSYFGALSAQGTEADPIIFTSNASEPAPGDWKGIYFRDEAYDPLSVLAHCIVEYGGHTNSSNIRCASSSPKIRESIIQYSSAHGIYLSESSNPTIGGEDNGNLITENVSHGIYSAATSHYQSITHNTITNNGSYAIRVRPGMNNVSNNSCYGNKIDKIAILGEEITSTATWRKNSVPYVVLGDVTVRKSNYTYNSSPSAATLTIEPGVEVQFSPGTGLYIGLNYYRTDRSYFGALSAQGTEAEPIIFTSNASEPAPGDWKGIYFKDETYDIASFLEHCIVEYGGHTHNANVYLANAKPTIQYNTIRNSSHSGIYVNGTGANGAAIRCNNLKDNYYGVTVVNNAAPVINNNNFLRNQTHGINNTGSAAVNATDNWWNDANGPGYNGDDVSGNVNVDSWLLQESDCIASPPTNTAPFVPKNPVPANSAVRVPVIAEGQPIAVTLGWAGGDPNPWDAVVYDVYFGAAEDTLVKVAEGLDTTSFDKAGLEEGLSYYWKIVARDDAGGQSAGPVWHFTTLGSPPDLIVSDIAWQPATDLQAGQTITFAATVENTGSGPVVDAFKVQLYVDGSSIGSKTVNPVMAANTSLPLIFNWTAATGSHTIEARADSQGQVNELFEENNSRIVNLPYVKDPTPPDLVGTVPANGASLKALSAIQFTLNDQYGVVDDAAVIAGVVVLNSASQPVGGTVSEGSDRFTFTPTTVPLADDTYSVSLTARDLEGNTKNYNFSFTVDGQPPAEPTITGGAVLSGLIKLRPAVNKSKTATIILTGAREANSAIYVNNQNKAALGSGNWSISLNLAQGDNALEIYLEDAAGNHSPSVWVDILVDSVAPAISAITPADNSFINAAPSEISVTFTEATSGLDIAESSLSVKDLNQQPVDGSWAPVASNQLVFTPTAGWADSNYTVNLQLADQLGNRSAAKTYHFTLDTAKPAVPVINPVSTPTHKPTQMISGTKEADAALLLNGSQIVGHTAQTIWTYTASLTAGDNSLAFVARDRAGNQSDPVTVTIFFDDVPPSAVDTLKLTTAGDGRTIQLDWTGYNEAAHGDVTGYRIYRSTAAFTDVSAATLISTVNAGNFNYTATDLSRATPYWFAAVAVDAQSNARTAVTPVSGTPQDVEPPGNVSNLKAQSLIDNQIHKLIFTWDHAADPDGDLAGYRVTFADSQAVLLEKAVNRFTTEGLNLSPATGYLFKVAAVDNDSNESSGTTVTGVTLLANPENLTAGAHSGYVDLSWSSVAASQYVKHYAVYASESDFSSVAGMTSTLTSTNTSAKVAGLIDNVTYYFAVTTVNLSDGEQKDVAAIPAKPEADSLGPEISSVKADGQPLATGATLTKPVTFSCAAQDPAGVSRVEFFIDAILVRTDYNAAYTSFWNVVAAADGTHTLTIDAYDTLGNSASENFSINVLLAKPDAPQITEPSNGIITNKPTVAVSGQAEKFTEVKLYNNGADTGVVLTVDALGKFSTPLTLAEGLNRLQAAAVNRAGEGPQSAEVLVTLDTTLPVSPSNLAAVAGSAGAVRLTWKAPIATEVAGYNLYRASSPFTTQQGAGRINTNPIQATTFDDLPPSDGTWYYRVSTVDAAANESELSAAAQVLADGTPPRAASIDYSPQGAFDVQTGTMAPGTVNVVLTVTELLQSAPYLSIAPIGGIPIAVQLSKDTDTAYSGFFVISDSTPGGTAYAIFSARDAVGNRGTQIDAGSAIQIDTVGPSVTRLTVSPPAPIENDEQSPVAVTVVFGLDEKIKSTEFPQLSYRLSGDQRDAITIDSLTELAAQAPDVQTWQAQFELPSDAGLNGAETFYFIYQGRDLLDNAGDRIQAQNIFQVYQGDLPPLAPPLEFKAQALPGGKIRLTWIGVEHAVGYQVYRKSPGESELTAYARLDAVETFEDEPAEDGSYTYAIASIRRENDQEALSGLSSQVVVNSDAAAPGAPSNLTLELVANGIKVVWEPPPYTEDVTYSLYRSNQDITTIDGLTPLATGIGQTLVVDPTPSLSDHWYAVTAVDAVGNQSEPSNADYLNVQLLPVSGITVVQTDNQPPAVTWTHPGGDIAGYDIYLGAGDAPVKLNTVLLTGKAYTDTGYSLDERRYTIVTVDNSNVESLGRSITLPVLRAVLSDGSRIKRGIMNRLDYVVLNEGAGRVENIRLKVKVGSHDHISEPFNLDPGTSRTIPVVVGGYDDLAEGIAALTTTIEVKPQTNETVQIIRGGQIEVADGTLGLQILNEEFTRAASGRVQFSIENTGDAVIEIVTAKNSGNSASDQITFYLLDEDGNVLSTQAFKQATGNQLVTLSNKNTVARIGAGETFRSDLISMAVPANAPDNVIIRLAIAHVYYHQGQATQVAMDGLATTHAVTLADTAYYGELLDITPQNSTGDQDIVITGQAVERSTDEPIANVPLKLVITLNGFERAYDVYTGEDGTFTHSFQPLSGESGIYRVRAVHPDLTDKPVHGQFVINKVAVTPSTLNLNAPKNYTNTIQIRVQTGDGTPVDNLRLEFAAEDQPTGEKPAGIHLTPGQPVAQLGGKKTAYLPFTIWADNTAGTTEKMILKVKAGTTDPVTWGTVSINARFSEAKPSLIFTPNRVETGVARDKTVSETINLQNKGLADLYDMQLSLLDAARNPAPSWIYLNSAVNQGNLAVGETKAIGFAVSPTAAVAEGDYFFYLRVAAANHPTTDINLYVAVTQQGQGNAMFKVSDIYTGTNNTSGAVIQGLAGAKVKLQNEAVLTQEYLITTDSLGEAWFEDLPAGRYKCRITANNHQEYIGRVWIKPGVTTVEDIFLDYNLVTVEWSVTETTIQDKYDIVLTAVYETNVPAAVVVIEPASVTLPQMRAGDVFNGEFTLTNYGLIRADNLNFTLPADDQNFKYEMLGGLPESLEAKQRITVAYRVTSLKSLDNEDDGAATGGGCYSYRKCAQATYTYECANEVTANGSTTYCWTSSYGSCGSSGGPGTGGGGGTWSVGGGGSAGGTVSKPAPQPKQIEGVKCFPEPPREEKFCLGCWVKDTFGNIFQDTFSSVNLVMREYYRDHVDLSVKAPGGTIEAKRWYYDNQWLWEHDRNKLSFQSASIGGGIESIDKGGVKYERSSTDADIFIHDIFRIVKTETGYRWQDPKGGWIDYNASGNVTSHGSRSGVLAKLLYQDGKLSGVADRNDTQLLWYETDDDGLIRAVRDSDNRRVEYAYTGGRLSRVTDVLDFETRFEYDNQGRLEKIIEPAGRTITVSYDRYNGVASVVDSRGEGFFFDYDFNEATREQYARIETSAGKVKEVWYDRDFETRRVDINGRTVEKIAKDGRNLLVTDEQGNVTRKNYDEWDNLTQVIYPDGSSVSYAYEHTFNKRIEATDENDVITRYAYDANGNLLKKTEAAGTEYERITGYTYDDDGNLLTTRRLADDQTTEALTQLSYDDLGNLTSITDPEDGITRFTSHDAMGNVLTKIDARGKAWDYEYDNAGQLKKIIDPLDNATELFYDEMGKKIKEVDANNNEKTYEYDARNNLIKVTDALGNITRFDYDADGKLLRQIDPEEKTISYEYDLDGRLLKTTDGNGNQIAMEYADAAGSGCSSCSAAGGASNQPSRITYPTFSKEFLYDKRGRKTIEKDVLSATETYLTDFDYDPAGNLIARTDKEDKTTSYAYDGLNRLQTVTDPLAQDTAYFYDNRDNLTALTDAAGSTTWFEYDRNNRLVKEIRPEGQQTTYQYDKAGNLTVKVDAKDQKTEYDYDDAGRLGQIRYFSAADHVNAAKTVTFSYDAAGNLTGYNDGITSAIYTYDDLYLKLSEKIDYGTFEQTNSYTYYNNGLKKTFTGPDGVAYAYTYDDNNQLTGVNIPGAGYITYSSYQWNRPTEVILPGGSKREYVYDPLMRVKSIAAKDPAQNILLNYQYNYDKMDNITAKVTEHGGYDYGYDDLYRLTGADNPVQNDEGFSYDAVGNRLTAAGVADNWSYNDNNELQGYAGVSFEYDDNGNMTQKTDAGQVTNYIYNVEDRLTEVWNGAVGSGSLISQYYYDPFGRRLWKEVNGQRTYFVYADEGLVAEVDANGNVTKSYGYKPGSTWTTDPLFMKVGDQYYFYQNDHLGTPQKLTAVNGAVVWSAKYSSFGEADVDPSSIVENNLRFPGQYFDHETKLHYNYYRYYNPDLGRYIRLDPLNFAGGDVVLYAYTFNNPIKYLDPIGLSVLAECTYTSGGAIVGAAYIECDLIGECKNGFRQVAKYTGVAFGLTFGAPLGRTYFTVYSEDDTDVRAFSGKFKVNTISMAFGPGVSGGEICFHNRCFYPKMSPQVGVDFSADLMEGEGQVYDIKKVCCD